MSESGFLKCKSPLGTPAADQPQDLVHRDFDSAGPDRLWVADITYVRTWEGWLYLAVMLDAFSRRVIGWALADHLRTELAIDALNMALTTRRPAASVIHHSDRGSQTGFKGSSQHLPRGCDAQTKAEAIRSGAASPDALTGPPAGGTSRGAAALLGGHRQGPDE